MFRKNLASSKKYFRMDISVELDYSICLFLNKSCKKCRELFADIETRLSCNTCVLLNIKQEPQTEITVTCHHCGLCLDMQMGDPASVCPFSSDNCAWKDDVNFILKRHKASDEMRHCSN